MNLLPESRSLRNVWLSVSVAALILAAPAIGSAQESLPFPPTPSGSKAARTMQQSTYAPNPAPRRLPADAPNIIIMMLDDAGFALPSTYGGDVNTPTLSRVANAGISYNRFHNAAMCSPTRAALLTGRNHHRVGNGQIAEFANDWDGYSGVIPRTAATVAKVLGYYGYSTSAFGKWHNTPANETAAVGPYTNWPVGPGIGFDYFYGFLAGESSQYEPAVVENTVRLSPAHGRKDYHFTEDMTDKAVSWIRQQHALTPDRPFLMYWAPGAVHGPHQVAKEWADKYKGKFDEGWDVMRERVFARQKQLGWIPGQHRAHAAAGDDSGVERYSRQRKGVSASPDGGVRRLRRAHRHRRPAGSSTCSMNSASARTRSSSTFGATTARARRGRAARSANCWRKTAFRRRSRITSGR